MNQQDRIIALEAQVKMLTQIITDLIAKLPPQYATPVPFYQPMPYWYQPQPFQWPSVTCGYALGIGSDAVVM